MTNSGILALQDRYDALAAELDELAAAIAATEGDAAAARAELDELTDGGEVLQAMAEERAARNRLALLRRRQTSAQQEKNRLSVEVERARLNAIRGVVDTTKKDMAAALVDVYRRAIEARDQVYQAQRQVGAYPADSPFDGVCAALEDALRKTGAIVTPDSSRSVTVVFGDFQYTRRPIGWVAPVAVQRRFKGIPVGDLQALKARLNAMAPYSRDGDY